MTLGHLSIYYRNRWTDHFRLCYGNVLCPASFVIRVDALLYHIQSRSQDLSPCFDISQILLARKVMQIIYFSSHLSSLFSIFQLPPCSLPTYSDAFQLNFFATVFYARLQTFKGNKGKKERVSKQKLLKDCHQGQNVTVLAILECLKLKNFYCQLTMMADNTFQCSMAPPL